MPNKAEVSKNRETKYRRGEAAEGKEGREKVSR